jgi:YVTN family beta-propeller protein
MKTKYPLPKGFSGTKGVSGILAALVALALLLTASGAGADPFAYISNLSGNSVTVIDGTTVLTPPTTPIGVGAQPFGVAVNPTGTRAYVANSNMFDTGAPSVSVIDTASLTEVTRITVGIDGQPTGVAVNEDGSRVYVANNNGKVAVIDTATNTVINTLTPPPNTPRQLAGIVVAAGAVWAVDLATGEVISVTDSSVPGLFLNFTLMMGIAADPSGSRLYVSYGDTNGDLQIAIIDVATSFAQQTFTSVLVSTSGNDAGFNPGGVAVSPSGAFVYAPIASENRLAMINTANNSVTYRTMNSGPFGVAVDPLGTRVYVGNSGNRTVTVLDAATNTVLQQSVSVGANPMVFGSFVAGARPAPPPPQFVLTVLTGGNGFGSVTANPMPTNGTYPAGTVVTLTATPNSASNFTGWSGCTATGSNTCTVTMDAAKTVTANFALKQYALTVLNAGNGSGSFSLNPTGGTYNHGTMVTISASPAASSVFTSWSGCAQQSGATCTVTMDGPKTVTVTFTLKQYTLTVSNAGNGSGTVTPPGGTYNHGTTVTLSASPAASSVFTSWSGCTANGSSCSVTMDAAKTVTATFTLKQYTLGVSMAGNGTGSVGLNPPGGTYNHGTSVSLTATPSSGSQFGGWSNSCGTSNPCVVVMNGPQSVTATFTTVAPPPPVQYQLTLSKDGDGSGALTANPSSATGKYNSGAQVGVAHSAAPGSKFVKWAGACSGTGPCNVTMNAAKSVVATFTRASQPPATCDEKIKDWQKKVAERKNPWWHDYQLRISLKMYAEAQSELGKAKGKVGGSDKRYLRAEDEFDNGKSALCHGHYWRADNEFWDAYQIAHQILKQFRR